MPPDARTIVLNHILLEHNWRVFLHAAVVMPDHAHLLLTPTFQYRGITYALCEITKGIKGSSGREINKLLDRTGRVWQKESFDHELRSDENTRKTAEYIVQNPVRKGLCCSPDEYPWVWREWIEGRLRVGPT